MLFFLLRSNYQLYMFSYLSEIHYIPDKQTDKCVYPFTHWYDIQLKLHLTYHPSKQRYIPFTSRTHPNNSLFFFTLKALNIFIATTYRNHPLSYHPIKYWSCGKHLKVSTTRCFFVHPWWQVFIIFYNQWLCLNWTNPTWVLGELVYTVKDFIFTDSLFHEFLIFRLFREFFLFSRVKFKPI